MWVSHWAILTYAVLFLATVAEIKLQQQMSHVPHHRIPWFMLKFDEPWLTLYSFATSCFYGVYAEVMMTSLTTIFRRQGMPIHEMLTVTCRARLLFDVRHESNLWDWVGSAAGMYFAVLIFTFLYWKPSSHIVNRFVEAGPANDVVWIITTGMITLSLAFKASAREKSDENRRTIE